jgi:hypothetical protein
MAILREMVERGKYENPYYMQGQVFFSRQFYQNIGATIVT